MMMKEKTPNHKVNSKRLFKMLVLLVPVLSLALHSCTERIDIKTDESFQKLSVEGYITPEEQVIKLRETSGYFSQEAPLKISDAVVTVSDSSGTFQFSETPEHPGDYTPPQDFKVIPQSTYHLEISLKDAIGGESNFEADATMPKLSDQVDSARAIWRADFESWVIELYAFEPPGPNYYMFNAFVNGKAVTDSLSRVGITDDRIVDGLYLYGVYILFLREGEINYGDTLMVSTSSISEDYYRYLSEAKDELHPNNPLFSGPPANIKSNISNGAVGYFAVFSSTFTTSIVKEYQ